MSTINGMKLMKDTCSLTNALLANPRYTEPKIGTDVTELMWSDRCAYRITAVDKDKKGFVMARYNAKWIGKHYGDERYQYEDENGNPLLSDQVTHVRFRYGKWMEVEHSYDGKVYYHKISLGFGYREEYRDPSF